MSELTEEQREQRRRAGRLGAQAVKERGTNRNGWMKRRDALDVEQIRKRIKVGMLVSRLEAASEGRVDMSATQVAAAKILLDKAVPSLSAVEQTTIDPSASLGESDIRDQLRTLLASHPDVVAELLGEQARQAREASDPAPEPISRAA